MKKLLLSAAVALAGITASAEYHVWNFGEMLNDGEMTETVTIDGLTFYNNYVEGAEKQSVWTVDAGTTTAFDVTYTKRLKPGGSSEWNKGTEESPLPEEQWTPVSRLMSFQVDGPTDIMVVYAAAGSSGERFLKIWVDNASNNPVTNACSSVNNYTYHYNGEAATIYVGCDGGVNFYGITTSEFNDISQASIYTYIDIDPENPANPENLDPAAGQCGTIAMSPGMPTAGFDEGTEVTISYSPAGNFVFSYWDVDGVKVETNPLKVIAGEASDVTAYVKYVDPFNAVPGYLDASTAKSGVVYDWLGKTGSDGKQRAVKVDGELWPNDAQSTEGYSWNGLQGGKGSGNFAFQIRVTEAGNYNLLCATSAKTQASNFSVAVYDGEDNTGEIVSEANFVQEPTGQDWVYEQHIVPLEGALTTGVKYIEIKYTGDSSRASYMLYAALGIGDNYGNWAERNPAGIEEIAIDNASVAPVKYYNLQGIEVKADTKGLLILSNGTKVLNK